MTQRKQAMGWRARAASTPALALLALLPMVAAAQDSTPPYWVSISRKEAVMRRGPSELLPAQWLYVRRGLPMRVLAVRGEWRQVQDPAGVIGWMHVRLLTSRRAAIVTGGIVTGGIQPMRTGPSHDAPIAYRAEPGVVGMIRNCGPAWCQFDVNGKTGWIATDGIWGDGAA